MKSKSEFYEEIECKLDSLQEVADKLSELGEETSDENIVRISLVKPKHTDYSYLVVIVRKVTYHVP